MPYTEDTVVVPDTLNPQETQWRLRVHFIQSNKVDTVLVTGTLHTQRWAHVKSIFKGHSGSHSDCMAGHRKVGFILLPQLQNNCMKTHAYWKPCKSQDGPAGRCEYQLGPLNVSC
jgi:hypothetical protein